ncbi:MAG TPA: RibD family protein [Chthonomonadales bacterium]|nr:RibD family protein [Chthonomonadales bacterium]
MPIERLLDLDEHALPPEALYTAVRFPPPPPGRPYVFANMVATADGKTLQGPVGSTAKGLGGPTDQILMRRLQSQADGMVIGAATLRAGNVVYPPDRWRFAVTASGDIPLDNRFFRDAPDRAVVVAPETIDAERARAIERCASLVRAGAGAVDVHAALVIIRERYGVRRLLLEGGSELNWAFVAAAAVDEVFLTLAPKIKGGSGLPTVVGGAGLPGHESAPLALVSVYRDADELYLRYRARAVADRSEGRVAQANAMRGGMDGP